MAVTISSITRSGSPKPPRIVLYGVEGVGKSTFGASAPTPIFIRTEDGLDALSVDTFPKCESFDDVLSCLGSLAEEDHEYETVVLDSADWTEHLIELQVAKDHGIHDYNVQAKELAYGRGSKAVADKWRIILDALDYLRNERNMQVIILAHSQIKRFDDPTTDAYDRYLLDLNKESSATLSEWADIVGFANFVVATKEEKVGINGKKVRGLGTGERFLHTQERPAFKAKSRWAIPGKMALDYDVFAGHMAEAMKPTKQGKDA